MYSNLSHFNTSTKGTNVTKACPILGNSIDITWLIISILTLATNLSVLLILCRRNLRILSNAVLCSMFICGCAFALLYLFPGRAMIIWRVSSNFVCNVIPLSGVAFTTCYNLHLCAICIDKIISIISPFRHRELSSRKNVIIIISIIWIIPFLSSFIPLATYMPYLQKCGLSQSRDYLIVQRTFYAVHFVVMIIIPIIFTILLYIVAFIKVNRRHRIKISTISHTHYHQARQVSMAGRNLKILLQMLVMLGFFAFCWLPYFIAYAATSFSVPVEIWQLLMHLNYLALSYPAANPILFAYYTNSIRDEIKILIARYFKTPIHIDSTGQSSIKNSRITAK